MSKLSLLGGSSVIVPSLPRYKSIGLGERDAMVRVAESGCLSGFYGSWCEEFFGGPEVKAFEKAWRLRFQVKHAVSVNSATSGLMAALGAVGTKPADEVIVPPYTMSATAVAPLVYGAVPVFADIEPETFCIDIKAVKAVVTPRTRAVIAVNLFGHPAKLSELRSFCDEGGIYLIEDNAQGPLAEEDGKYAGCIGHIGVFSLNYHKHIHTGEGGMCVTDDDDLALKLQLIRNHGENAVEELKLADAADFYGFNFRLTEPCAAVGVEQLKRIDEHVGRREKVAGALTEGIKDLEGLTPPVVRSGCRHVYYVWAAKYDETVFGVSREVFSRALSAEGFPHFTGYCRPLYLLPLFQGRMLTGGNGSAFKRGGANYEKGICPIAEHMYEKQVWTFEPCMYYVSDENQNLLIEAIHKVHAHRDELRQLDL